MKAAIVFKLFAAGILIVGAFVTTPTLKGDAACDAACAAQCAATRNCVNSWCNYDGTCGQLIFIG